MPANLGMIALGKAKTLEKRLIKLEETVEKLNGKLESLGLRSSSDVAV